MPLLNLDSSSVVLVPSSNFNQMLHFSPFQNLQIQMVRKSCMKCF